MTALDEKRLIDALQRMYRELEARGARKPQERSDRDQVAQDLAEKPPRKVPRT